MAIRKAQDSLTFISHGEEVVKPGKRVNCQWSYTNSINHTLTIASSVVCFSLHLLSEQPLKHFLFVTLSFFMFAVCVLYVAESAMPTIVLLDPEW